MKSRLLWIALPVALLAAAGGLYWWMQQTPTPADVPPAPQAMAPAPAPEAASAPVSPAAPAIKHPIETAQAASAAPTGAATSTASEKTGDAMTDGLAELLGRKAVLSFVNTDNFASRLASTVDNLDRAHAASRLWPVNPTAPKFRTDVTADDILISPSNAARYTPMVQFIASVDAARAAALYRQMYPRFQQAYEDLGYPGKYFNDRVVQVIDHLLQTPTPAGPLKLKLTEVKGPVESATPWLRYEYADATLESRSAGQKLLMRIGPDNARQIKAKLTEVRGLIARADAAR